MALLNRNFFKFVEKTRKHFFLAVFVAVLFGVIFALKRSVWVICFSKIVKLTRRVFFVDTACMA